MKKKLASKVVEEKKIKLIKK